MKKLLLILFISLFATLTKASSVYIGCVHGRYFIAKYDDNGNLVSYGFGLGCGQAWCMQVYMTVNPVTPTGVEFDHPTEDRINAMPVESFVKPQGEIEAQQVDEQVKTNEGQHVYVYGGALRADIRQFLFEN